MENRIPRQPCLKVSPNLSIEDLGDDIVIWDEGVKRFHLLNASAYAVLRACDGFNDLRAIAGILSKEFEGVDLDTLIADIQETVEVFREKGLIQ